MSKISRKKTVAYARKTAGEGGGDEATPEAEPPAASAPAASAPGDSAPPESIEAARAEAAAAEANAASAPATVTPAAPAVEAATPAEPALEAEPARARTETVAMPAFASIGAPPEMPAAAAAPVATGDVESPTHMPGPREIPPGNPDDPAAPPGHVPRGDSRSMRRRADRYEFALIYRLQTFVISRVGAVGTRGVWRVVEYPTSSSASNAYAREASRFVSEGFSDYRD